MFLILYLKISLSCGYCIHLRFNGHSQGQRPYRHQYIPSFPHLMNCEIQQRTHTGRALPWKHSYTFSYPRPYSTRRSTPRRRQLLFSSTQTTTQLSN